jgi:hypothetical protein
MLLNEFFGVYDAAGSKKEDEKNKKTYEEAELADEIYEFILHNDKLHKEQFIPIAQKIHRNPTAEHAKNIWLPLVNKGCMEFYHHNKMIEDPVSMFHKKFREDLCELLYNSFNKDILKGDFKLGD